MGVMPAAARGGCMAGAGEDAVRLRGTERSAAPEKEVEEDVLGVGGSKRDVEPEANGAEFVRDGWGWEDVADDDPVTPKPLTRSTTGRADTCLEGSKLP